MMKIRIVRGALVLILALAACESKTPTAQTPEDREKERKKLIESLEKQLKPFEGAYVLDSNDFADTLSFRYEEGFLIGRPAGKTEMALAQEAPMSFRSANGAQVVFDADDSQKRIAGLTFYFGVYAIKGKKIR
ncbi:MAG: hypothetical protein EAZ89_07475 [Bacteroidetes bacterium]|nr:MAG: hypothetical protein EAZ89_07475 [Bacteroidota bacterium]